MPTTLKKPAGKRLTAKQKLLNWLRKSWEKHTANLDLKYFEYKGKRYKAQLMGFVCMNDGAYYLMVSPKENEHGNEM